MGQASFSLRCDHIHHWFGNNKVLYDVNLTISPGQVVGLVGPSGCGKSTLLRAIIGTHPPRQGRVLVCSAEGVQRAVTAPGRDRGIVYQNYALFEFLTVLDNVCFGPMLDETGPAFRLFAWSRWRRLRKTHEQRALELLDRLGLGNAVQRYPSELSGGMRQRVAIAQALIMRPQLLLLDEPFGALDEATREELQRLLLQIYADNQRALGQGRHRDVYTTVIVTHELTEAIFVSDRVIGLSQYWDWPAENLTESPGATIVYDKPAPVFDPNDLKHHEQFVEQRAEVYRAVFDPTFCQPRHVFVTYQPPPREG